MDLQISVWSNYFRNLTPEETVKTFSNKGFFAMELSTEDGEALLSRGNIAKVAAEFRRYVADYGIKMSQGHLKLWANVGEDNPEPVISELLQWIELYSELGIENMVFHCGHNEKFSKEQIFERRVSSLNRLKEPLKGTPYRICLENLIDTKLCVTTSADIKEIIGATDGENVGICLDTGHLNIVKKESQYDFIVNSGQLLNALHITDNEGRYDQHLMPYSLGMDCEGQDIQRIDFEEVVRGLKAVNYSGLFNFEIPGESDAPHEVLLAKLDYIKAMANYLIALY